MSSNQLTVNRDISATLNFCELAISFLFATGNICEFPQVPMLKYRKINFSYIKFLRENENRKIRKNFLYAKISRFTVLNKRIISRAACWNNLIAIFHLNEETLTFASFDGSFNASNPNPLPCYLKNGFDIVYISIDILLTIKSVALKNFCLVSFICTGLYLPFS